MTCVDAPGALADIVPSQLAVVPAECDAGFRAMQADDSGLSFTAEQACSFTAGEFKATLDAVVAGIFPGLASTWSVPAGFTESSGMNQICAATCDSLCIEGW